MRIFVGVELDADARRVAKRTAGLLRKRLGSGVQARWVDAENMHLTVRFIGHVPDDRLFAVIDALAPPVQMPAFDVELAGCGRFPPTGAPRVLWIGVARGLPALAGLHAEFDRRLLPFGYEPETRPFAAHLTLARIKDLPRGRAAAIQEALAGVKPHPVSFRVGHATIFESRLSPTGAKYHPLHQVPLAGS